MSGCSYSPRAEMNHWRMRMWSVVEKKVGKKVEKKSRENSREKSPEKSREKNREKSRQKSRQKSREKNLKARKKSRQIEKIERKIWMALTGLRTFQLVQCSIVPNQKKTANMQITHHMLSNHCNVTGLLRLLQANIQVFKIIK